MNVWKKTTIILNVDKANNRASKHKAMTDMKIEIDKFTNTVFSWRQNQ